jgi:hypothetical protein
MRMSSPQCPSGGTKGGGTRTGFMFDIVDVRKHLCDVAKLGYGVLPQQPNQSIIIKKVLSTGSNWRLQVLKAKQLHGRTKRGWCKHGE